jgi:hypothetical protein
MRLSFTRKVVVEYAHYLMHVIQYCCMRIPKRARRHSLLVAEPRPEGVD